jgi:hypothetical protein
LASFRSKKSWPRPALIGSNCERAL